MSFVVAAPDMVQTAAEDLAGIRSVPAEAVTTFAAPTTAVAPAAGDEVSAAVAKMFGDFGKEFQSLSAHAQAFHAEFADVIDAGAGPYLSTEIATAEQALANVLNAPARAMPGLGAAPGIGGLLTGGTGGLTGILGGLGNLGPLGSTLGSLLPGLPNILGGLGNSLTGLTNSLLPGLLQINIGDAGPYVTGIAGPYEELFYNTWNNLQSIGATWLADPFPFLRQFLANQMGYAQTMATSFGNAAQSIEAHASALPAAFQVASRAFSAGNYAGGLTDVETGLQRVFSGVGPDLAPIPAIPGRIAQNMTSLVQNVTNTSITPTLDVSALTTNPPDLASATLASATLASATSDGATSDNVVGLPVVLGVDLLGAPVSMPEVAGSSAAAFTAAVRAGNPAGAIATLIDAPAVIANGFLNGQATFPYGLNRSSLTGDLSSVGNVAVVGNFPLDGILVPSPRLLHGDGHGHPAGRCCFAPAHCRSWTRQHALLRHPALPGELRGRTAGPGDRRRRRGAAAADLAAALDTVRDRSTIVLLHGRYWNLGRFADRGRRMR